MSRLEAAWERACKFAPLWTAWRRERAAHAVTKAQLSAARAANATLYDDNRRLLAVYKAQKAHLALASDHQDKARDIAAALVHWSADDEFSDYDRRVVLGWPSEGEG
ncbi:MAG: hypothetical protein LC798_20210 [Chloroflexi bacterium]|nr:hypothetical protein [Chloroflexota bacterium]